MPSVEVQYKDAGALKFLKLLFGYFGFKVIEKEADALQPDSIPRKDDTDWQFSLIPGNKDTK